MFVSFMVEQKDVTDKVMSLGYEKLDNKKRDELIDSLENEMTTEVKKNDRLLHITAQPFYEATSGTLLPIATSPTCVWFSPHSKSMGKFAAIRQLDGPRQTCDFLVFRIYADPKTTGHSVAYSKDNVPYHPKRWAQVSLQVI